MTSDPRRLDAERLDAEMRSARRLARALVSDEHDSDDIAQEAWVTALERPPREGWTLRGWLAGIVKNHARQFGRTERRRVRRELEAVANSDNSAVEDTIERLDLLRHMLGQVRQLDEPYRSTILLRFVDGHDPVEVARRLGVPHATVRTRLKRGIEQLRARMDAIVEDGRRAWLIPFAAFSVTEPASAAAIGATAGVAAGATVAQSKTVTSSIALITMKKTTVALLAAAVVLVGTLPIVATWSGDSVQPGEEPEFTPWASGSVELAQDIGKAATAEGPPETFERHAVEAAGGATTGAMLLTVVWATEKSPAPKIAVELDRDGADSLFGTPRGITDDQGQCLFEGMKPGSVLPIIRRGNPHFGKRVEIVAGQRAEVTLEVKVGVTARGRVIDGLNAAVADADIVICGWAGRRTRVLTKSAVDGTFSVRGIPTACHLGARKRGYRPTPMRTLTASEGAEVEFTIVMEKGGSMLVGTVVGPDGQPVVGAAVRAGSMAHKQRQLPDGASAINPQCEVVRTDDAGRFEVESIVPGEVPVAVRGQGLAPWNQTVAVAAGRQTEITVHLEQGSTLFGNARGADGQPLADVTIRSSSEDNVGSVTTRTEADGSYRLVGVGTGTVEATASHDGHGKIKQSFDLVAGEQRCWDPALSAGLQVRVRVVDSKGEPASRAIVSAQIDSGQPGDRWHGFGSTDGEGRFIFKNCLPGRTIEITVRRKSSFPEATVGRVAPSREEVEIRLAEETWIYMEGTALGPDGKPLPNVSASPYLIKNDKGMSPVETVDPETGHFRFGPYPHGTYRVHFTADGFPSVQVERTVAPNETWDLGTLRFQRGGTLAVQLLAGTMELPDKLHLSIRDRSGQYRDRMEIRDGFGRSGPLAPGDYEFKVTGGLIAAQTVPFTIRVETETKIDVPVTQGQKAKVTCALPEGRKPSGRIELVVRDATGVVQRASIGHLGGIYERSLVLRRGSYTIEATWQECSARGALEVGTEATHATLQLR